MFPDLLSPNSIPILLTVPIPVAYPYLQSTVYWMLMYRPDLPTVNCILDAYVRVWPTYSQLHSGCLCTGLTYLQSTAFWMLMYRPHLPTVNCILDAYVQASPAYSQLHSGCLCTGLTYLSQVHFVFPCTGLIYLQSTAFWMVMYRPDLPTVKNSNSASCVFFFTSKLRVHNMVLWDQTSLSTACNFKHLKGIYPIVTVNLKIPEANRQNTNSAYHKNIKPHNVSRTYIFNW
jgi:hypothetical protein